MKSCLIIAGEKSGEEHAMTFLPSLKEGASDIHFYGVGGSQMKESGVELLYELKDFSTWGVTEAIRKVPFYYKAYRHLIDEVKKRDTKVAILIDFQTFNLKLAMKLEKLGVKVLYYVAPQAWVWKEWRTKYLQQSVDTLFCILPFEKKWFMDRGVSKAITIEHPLLKKTKPLLKDFTRRSVDFKNEEFNLLLLPGSRRFEIEFMLPEFIKAVRSLKEKYNFNLTIVKASSVDNELFSRFEGEFDKIYRDDQLDEALKEADFSFATSGTVNLSLALYGVPSVISYDLNLLNTFIAENIVKYKGFVSIPNLILGHDVYPELLGDAFGHYNLERKAKELFENKERYEFVINELKKVKELTEGEDIEISQYLIDKLKQAYPEG
ncbi:lipid-A-disaccharide synthase [Halobacteriovorax sp. BALOs_7]|uniref:lipid-A-disaccharide synthase n=1 Tax=unclassified Halobacteriovorax TaxID=2639665 RepID=UPI000EA03E12|nr:lipid-A-disaccharide synthase [Halobacteriovorax sp. BALOs_7]AYF43461.1 lipid-A-disaccharide synthase [Halobacteriovorax sp. BALOs_7]